MFDMNDFIEKTQTWVVENGIEVIFVVAISFVLLHFLGAIITRIVRRLVPRDAFVFESEEKKREDTLISIIKGFLSILIWVGAIFYVLESLGVPVAPLITGAGIVGVALGFGSQSLVKDVINGVFIIVENQFRIGDVIEVGGFEGTVEGMTLRVTRLRELNGTIHYVPNGEIKIASNKTRDFSMVDLKVNVGYGTKIDHLEKVINKVGEELLEDPEFTEHFIEPPRFLRIDDLSDYAITARILAKVYPKHQFLVAGELRKRLKHAFEKHDIDIPYPTRVVHNITD